MSSNNNNAPVRVTGEERQHPAIRKLARACIAIARLRLAKEAKDGPDGEEQSEQTPEPSEADRHG